MLRWYLSRLFYFYSDWLWPYCAYTFWAAGYPYIIKKLSWLSWEQTTLKAYWCRKFKWDLSEILVQIIFSSLALVLKYWNVFKYRKVTSSKPVYYSILNSLGQRSQYISIKFPLHNSLKITKCATNQDRLVLLATLRYAHDYFTSSKTVFISLFFT